MNNDIESSAVISEINAYFGPAEPTPETVTSMLYEAYQKAFRRAKPKILTADIVKELGRLGLMLAGGAVTSIFSGSKVNDLDFYIKDAKRIDEATAFLSIWFPEPPYVSDNAITFKRKSKKGPKVWTVQLIKRFTGGPTDIFSTFDFTITQGLFDFENECFVFGERFLQDIATRKLTYLGGSRYPICALWRTQKYQARGYSIPGSTIMHIALSIVRLEIKTYKDLKEQLLGVDTVYLQELLSQAKYDQALPVDYGQFLKDAFDSMNVHYEEPENV